MATRKPDMLLAIDDANNDPVALDELVEVNVALQDPHKAFLNLFPHIPGWSSSDSFSNVEITRISGAMTNLVYLAQHPEAPPATSKVIIRIFGRGSLLFSRHQERGIFLAASRLGIGPQCFVEFGNGRIEQFLPGAAVTAASIRQPEVAAAIASTLSDFHVTMFTALPLIRVEAGTQGASPRSDDTGIQDALWERLRGWLAAATAEAPEEIEELVGFGGGGGGGAQGEAEIEAMEQAAERDWGPSWLALTHNDLQYGNVLLNCSSQEERNCHEEENETGAIDTGTSTGTTTATLIDYEYCTVGDVAFDIANHFCEYAADYHRTEEEMLDWNRLPTPQEQTYFCRKYIESLIRKHPNSLLAMKVRASCGVSPSKQLQHDEEQRQEQDRKQFSKEENGFSPSTDFLSSAAEVLVERVQAYMPLSHLKWGLWGILQSKLSEVEFDYMEYAKKRLQQYHATKKVLLSGSFE